MKKNRDIRIDSDPDFIVSPKYNNSLQELLDANPDGVPDSIIAKVLRMSQEEIDKTYKSAIMKLKGVLDDEQ